ncbi:MAG: diacylglycerol kinase [Pseudomonadota bacterium]|jgi:diacylglycerol kinase (ATP)
MTDRSDTPRKPAAPRKGLLHAVDATRYSIAGFGRLMQESAARQELLFGAAGLGVLLWARATPAEIGIFAILFLILLAAEALNTAIEVLVDRISPEWSQAGKEAKDLGSLAVGLVIAANLGFLVWVLVF